ncbi:glycosyltransferase 87 family protein [Jatrophihabitans sp. GAS493]|uniref:glycosyltransferase 87 family protein n=1 Tax=Jatrophihabitans sp. GAS493 TaxID=1907575 RepID=UPI0012FDF0D8|nr:glycosyltransferase 87 family protein [Jatrophihabitans sp. GAS493]
MIVAALFFVRLGSHRLGFGGYRGDLDVYRLGVDSWLHNRGLYSELPRTQHGGLLLFTYPPFAAVLMLPLAIAPLTTANLAITAASMAALWWTIRRVFNLLDGGQNGTRGAVSVGRLRISFGELVALPLALLLEPTRSDLCFGQINLLLMFLVAFDCLGPLTVHRADRHRGWFVGMAAAVKLTPAIFLLFFLAIGDRRAARNMVASFATMNLIAYLLAPSQTELYWRHIVFQTGRIGEPIFAGNQSLLGLLARAGLTGPSLSLGWLMLSALAALLAWRGMRRILRSLPPDRARVFALLVNALAGLLISPISWTHHWVWGVVGLLALTFDAANHGRPRHLVVAVSGLLLLAVAPPWWLPNHEGRELTWNLSQQVLGSSYVLGAFAALLTLVLPRSKREGPAYCASWRTRRRTFATVRVSRPTSGDPPAS